MIVTIAHSWITLALGVVMLMIGILRILLLLRKWVRGRRPPAPPGRRSESGSWREAAAGILLALSATALLALPQVFPLPKVSIGSPVGSVEVQAGASGSVYFPVAGESSNLPDSWNLYVLVHHATDWHVQRPASRDDGGHWRLDRAWIGDASAPVSEGTQLDLEAVATRRRPGPDAKIDSPSELEPEARSPRVTVTVTGLRTGGAG